MSTVLLINDSQEIRRAIVSALDAAGIRCIAANTAAEGIRRYDQERPVVVITDLKLRFDDSALLVEVIRRDSGVPILILAGNPDDYNEAARLLGDIGVLRTPIDPIALVRNVRARSRLRGSFEPP